MIKYNQTLNIYQTLSIKTFIYQSIYPLTTSPNSSWEYPWNTVSETFMNCLKSLKEVDIEDVTLGPISVEKSLIPLAILFWSNVSMPSVPFCSNNFIYRAPSCLHFLFTAIKLSQVRKLFRLSAKNLKHRFVSLICKSLIFSLV